MRRVKRLKVDRNVVKYRYFIYREHPSGIGSTFVREAYTEIQPSFETSFWFDATNGMWAKWDKDKEPTNETIHL